MGIIVPDCRLDVFQGVFSNVYMAFSTNDITFNLSNVTAYYGVWVNYEARQANGQPILLDFIKYDSDGTNVYSSAYEKLKEKYPGSIDA